MKCLLRWGAWLLVLLFLIPSVLGQTLNTTIYSDPSKDGWVDTFVCSSGDDINALSSLRVGQGSVSVTSNYRSFVGHPVNGEVERGSALSGSQIWFPVRLSI